MKRVFSVLRRKAGLIDIVIPRQAGVDQYRLKFATNWDQTKTAFLTVPPTGYLDPAVANLVHVPDNGDNCRIVFKPSTYSGTLGATADTAALWLQVAFVIGGVEQNGASANPPSAITLVQAPGLAPTAMQALSGTAPNVANLGLSTQIDLPRMAENVQITNLGETADLLVALAENGPEFRVPTGTPVTNMHGTVSSLWVRGDSATVDFQMTWTTANPR